MPFHLREVQRIQRKTGVNKATEQSGKGAGILRVRCKRQKKKMPDQPAKKKKQQTEVNVNMKIVFWALLFFIELGLLICAVRDLADAIRGKKRISRHEPEQVEYTEEECGRNK